MIDTFVRQVVRAGMAVLLICASGVAADDAARLAVVQAGLEARRSAPDPWFDATFALSALHLDRQTEDANLVLQRILQLWPVDPASKGEPEAYWAFPALARILLTHGASGTGRLSEETEAALKTLFWPYTSVRSNPDTSNTWVLEGSENHDLMRKSVHYLVAAAFASDPAYSDRAFWDGTRAVDHRDRWSAYFRAYCEERARKGLLVEVASPTYQKYDLQCLVNLRDLAPDALVRGKSEILMHLLWADWAQDQVAGYRGGGKSRVYTGSYSRNGATDGMFQAAHLYFDLTGSAGDGPVTVLVATSDYAPPEIVRDIALSRPTLHYTSFSRRPGAGTVMPDPRGYGNLNVVDPDASLLRVTRVTPDYVLGTVMFDPEIESTSVSAQNRWSGVVFPTGPDRRVFLGCGSTREDKAQTYDALFTAQSGPVLVARKKLAAHKYNLTPYVVVPTAVGARRVEGDWLFVKQGTGYVGVTVAGGYTWDGDRMVLANEWAPILMVCGSEGEQGSFDAFVAQVRATTVTEESGWITYRSLGERVSVPRGQDALPRIGERAPDLQPAYTYQSPYVNAPWDSPVIRLSCGDQELVLDFRDGSSVDPGTRGDGSSSDFDKDGAVGFPDFVLFAGGYGKSSSDPGYDAQMDLDGDGTVAFLDFILFARNFGWASG